MVFEDELITDLETDMLDMHGVCLLKRFLEIISWRWSVVPIIIGHGTYSEGEALYASVAGVVQKMNKLVCVNPVKSRYSGDVGDVVVGRVREVGNKRWKVNTNSRMDSVLHLSSVNLPGGELRRKSYEDEVMMRDYLKEGDLISAEVQKTFHDGSLSLHTRNLKYGKLGQGILVQVAASLVPRRKAHFHSLPCGASLVLGNNGYIHIGPTAPETGDDGLEDDSNTGGFVQNLEPITAEVREVLARLANCVRLLAEHRVPLYDTTIVQAYQTTLGYQAKELLREEVKRETAGIVRAVIVESTEM